MSRNTIKFIIAAIILFMVIKTCSSSSSETSGWEKSPVDNIVQEYSDKSDFSIILADMDAEGTGSSTIYKHKYKVLIPEQDTVLVKETPWKTVSDVFFDQHINDLGMEIVYKKNGELHKETAPAGYSNFIGNDKYGRWQQRDGGSFWQFYGQYAFMSSLFNLAAYPVRRPYYDNYRGGFYGSGRSYYGGNGGPSYGTQTYGKTGRNTTWGSKPSTFKSDVISRVSRSATTTKRARSASRSSSRSSYRSRSGGSGK
ncbi:hypothetical protein ABWH96_13440 [Marivirga tractuosa]|uniref:hypothetical protein n=1 Tax=Marivirga tractuosa TaxID=1006 RepID=UPI0035D0B176